MILTLGTNQLPSCITGFGKNNRFTGPLLCIITSCKHKRKTRGFTWGKHQSVAFSLQSGTNRAVTSADTASVCLTGGEKKNYSTHNLFLVNLQLYPSNTVSPQNGGQAGGGSFLFTFAHGDESMVGGLKWLWTGSGNRICAPSPTTHTCDPLLEGMPAVWMVKSSRETPWQAPFLTYRVSFCFRFLQSKWNKWTQFNTKDQRCRTQHSPKCNIQPELCSGWITLFNVLQVLHNVLWRTLIWYISGERGKGGGVSVCLRVSDSTQNW